MDIFDRLFFYSLSFSNSIKPEYQRSIYKQIDFSQKLIALIGAKGVGKTTLLHQYMASLKLATKEVLYISLDNPVLHGHTLLEIAELFYQKGGKVLLVDEIHYQENFEQDLKTIHDFFDIQVIFSGSSAIALDKADLSRRAVLYQIPILSFREFLELKLELPLESFNIHEIMHNNLEVSAKIISKIKPLQYFDDYLKFGAYPFFMEGESVYILKLTEAINKVIESDLPLHHIDTKNIATLKKILVMLCESSPGEMNMKSLSNDAKDIPHSYLALDNIETGGDRKIPLWLFGFLY